MVKASFWSDFKEKSYMPKTISNTVLEPHKCTRALKSKKMKYSTSEDLQADVLNLMIG